MKEGREAIPLPEQTELPLPPSRRRSIRPAPCFSSGCFDDQFGVLPAEFRVGGSCLVRTLTPYPRSVHTAYLGVELPTPHSVMTIERSDFVARDKWQRVEGSLLTLAEDCTWFFAFGRHIGGTPRLSLLALPRAPRQARTLAGQHETKCTSATMLTGYP